MGGASSDRNFNRPGIFRMVVETNNYFYRLEGNQFDIFMQQFHRSITKTLRMHRGDIKNRDNNTYAVEFSSATNAVLCGQQVQLKFKYVVPSIDASSKRLAIAIAGGQVAEKQIASASAADEARNLCEIVKAPMVITQGVKEAYESENKNARIDKSLVRVISYGELNFLKKLLAYLQTNWDRPDFAIGEIGPRIGLSRSQVYRKLKSISGKAPNEFLREYRLHMALKLLRERKGSISRIAQESGFKSPSYFTKCFTEKFGLLPSKYTQYHLA